MKDLSKVIVRPLITEQGTDDARSSTTSTISRSRSRPTSRRSGRPSSISSESRSTPVRTMNYRGKIKRMGRHEGKRADWKKAVVTLAKDDTIDLFEIV